MGRYATRKTLKEYCALAGVTLYKHRLDGASYQYCAGGYIVNGYLGRSMLLSRLQYKMQQTLISSEVWLYRFFRLQRRHIYCVAQRFARHSSIGRASMCPIRHEGIYS